MVDIYYCIPSLADLGCLLVEVDCEGDRARWEEVVYQIPEETPG
jgi:hypothetical protein